jgi:hypothetical protein
VVSSGSIALGRSRLKLPRGPLKLEESQGAAAVGQIALARIWSEVLGAHGIGAGQILVTLQDTEERRRYLNARSTIAKLLEWRAVPVINENDTVATNEIRYGDNDRLAARVATMASADLLVLLSDIDGLYDAPPQPGVTANLIPLVERITPEIEAMAGASGSELSRGGMMTKMPQTPAPFWLYYFNVDAITAAVARVKKELDLTPHQVRDPPRNRPARTGHVHRDGVEAIAIRGGRRLQALDEIQAGVGGSGVPLLGGGGSHAGGKDTETQENPPLNGE